MTVVEAPAGGSFRPVEVLDVSDLVQPDRFQGLHSAEPGVIEVNEDLPGGAEAVHSPGQQPIGPQCLDRVVRVGRSCLGDLLRGEDVALNARQRRISSCPSGAANRNDEEQHSADASNPTAHETSIWAGRVLGRGRSGTPPRPSERVVGHRLGRRSATRQVNR